jgi:23S rRNA pseudouridine1911/1915/1917 synthase
VHMAAIGCPLVGDKLYGGDEQHFLRQIAGELHAQHVDDLGLPRHALHSHTLRFHHPMLAREIELCAPLPADMARLVDAAP